MKSDQAQFGECLREALRYAGVGEGGKELADLVVAHGGEAVSSQAAHDWIHGKKFPKPRNIKALAVALKVSTDQLFGLHAPVLRIGESRGSWGNNVHDQHAVEAFLALPSERRRLVRELITELSRQPKA